MTQEKVPQLKRKRFLELPMDARREILRLQADNQQYRQGINDWVEQYRTLRRMQTAHGRSIAVHWTIKQLLELDRV